MNDSEPRTGSRSLSLDDESFFSNEHLSYLPDEGPQEPFPGFVVYAPEYQPSSQKRGYLLSDEDDDHSSDSEPGQKRARTRSLSPLSFTTSSPDMSIKSDSQLELPWDMYDFNHLRHHSETTLYIDKTSCIGQLSDKFRHILLRPPRFGKTTFLSTLTEYYDIQGAAQFTERFGSLAVVTATPDAIPPHNQHLCLNFALSRIGVVSEAEEIESRLASYVSCKLETFIFTYQTELQLCEPEKFFQHADPQGQPDIVDLFAQLFELVRTSGYTLFVGIDDYDAPIRSYSFIHLQHPEIRELYAPPRAIEHLLESHFWGPLLAGAGVIDKLFITGTLSILGSPASVNLRMLDLKVDPALYSCCGFTEQEAIEFVRAFLDVPPDVASLRRACGQYTFCQSKMDEPVFHPQQLIIHTAALAQKPLKRFAPKSFPLLSGIFALLPEESDAPEAVTANGLIDLLACGIVSESRLSDQLSEFDGQAVTWSALRDLGALAYDIEGQLRVANDEVICIIHAHVDNAFSDRHDIVHALFRALDAYYDMGDPQHLLELFSAVLRDQMRRAFFTRAASQPVPNMCGVFELVMRNTLCAHSTQALDPVVGCLPPPSTYVVEIRNPRRRKEVRRWALKTLTLRGMWRAANPNADEPSIDALRVLQEELIAESEECLLARPYCELKTGVTALVGSFLEGEPGIPLFVAVGAARVFMRKPPSLDVDTHRDIESDRVY